MKRNRNSSAPSDHGDAAFRITRHDLGGQHWYLLEHLTTGVREWLANVTRYTSLYPKGQGFDKWLASQGSYDHAEKLTEDARERGHNVHAGIERLLRGQTLLVEEFTADEWKHLVAFGNWYEDYRPQVLAVEEIVYSLRRKIAGTLDLRGRLDGTPCVIDFKTAAGIYRHHEIQANEYGFLAHEMGLEVKAVGILRTGSRHKRGYEFKHWSLCQETHELFECLVRIGRDLDPAVEPKLEVLPSSLVLAASGASTARQAPTTAS